MRARRSNRVAPRYSWQHGSLTVIRVPCLASATLVFLSPTTQYVGSTGSSMSRRLIYVGPSIPYSTAGRLVHLPQLSPRITHQVNRRASEKHRDR